MSINPFPSSDEYPQWSQVTVRATFRNSVGAPTSPTTFEGWYRKPGASVSTAVVPVNLGGGVLTLTLPAFDVAGEWRWGIRGTSGILAAAAGKIIVRSDEKTG
jgi:hypothetical protein